MIRVNVAAKIEFKSNRIEIIRPLALLCLFCGMGYYGTLSFADLKNAEAEQTRAKIVEKQSQLQKLKVDVEEVKRLQARLGELKSRAERIRSLSAGRKQPVFFLDTLQQQHLERMWLTELTSNGDKVTLRGYALDHAVIAEYLRRLKLLGAGGEGDAGDLKDFVPPFMREEGSVRDEVARTDTIAPVRLTDVKIVRSSAETQESTLVQSFNITFGANAK